MHSFGLSSFSKHPISGVPAEPSLPRETPYPGFWTYSTISAQHLYLIPHLSPTPRYAIPYVPSSVYK